MKNKYWRYTVLFLIMMLISIILLILNNFFTYKIGIFNIFLLMCLVPYVIGLIFYLVANLKYAELEMNNPIKTLKFLGDYYDKVGYSLFTSGIVIIFTSSNLGSSIGLIIVGITLIIISQIKKEKHEKFNNDIKGK